jgi:hypothetical protein
MILDSACQPVSLSAGISNQESAFAFRRQFPHLVHGFIYLIHSFTTALNPQRVASTKALALLTTNILISSGR